MIAEGEVAPDFALPADDGTTWRLADHRGSWVVLYFYPKDNTPGCTTEAQEFRDLHQQFVERGAIVVGVSPDSAQSHQRFRAKHDLPFVLLSDPDHTVMATYGAWGLKKLYGREFEGVIRSTALIDPQGVVRKAWHRARAKGHAAKVLENLEALQAKDRGE